VLIREIRVFRIHIKTFEISKIRNTPKPKKIPQRIFLLWCVLLKEPHRAHFLTEQEILWPQPRHKL
jgi:hypothetical protein